MNDDSLVFEPQVTLLDSSAIDLEAVFGMERLLKMQSEGRYTGTKFENKIEYMGRLCYDSHDKGRPSPEYHENIITSNHTSVAEHSNLSFVLSGISRGLTHELVRQRIGVAYSQESTRYTDQGDFKMVVPPDADHSGPSLQEMRVLVGTLRRMYKQEFWDAKAHAKDLKRARGVARSWLPNGCQTKIGVTYNLVSFLHFLAIRGSRHADIEMPRLAVAMLKAARHLAPLYLDRIQIIPADKAYPVECIDVTTIPFEGVRYGK